VLGGIVVGAAWGGVTGLGLTGLGAAVPLPEVGGVPLGALPGAAPPELDDGV